MTALHADDVLAYLKDNTNFLSDYPEILESLTLPGEIPANGRPKKGLVDFQAYKTQRLQSNYDWLKEQHRELISNSRANLESLSQIHTAVLMILESDSFRTLVHTITQEFPLVFGVDACALLIESPSPNQPDLYAAGVHVVQPGMADFWLEGNAAQIDSQIEGDPIVFGPAAPLVRSQLLLRLEIAENVPLGLLAFGSREDAYFQELHSTDLVMFLARAVERAVKLWLEWTDPQHQ